MRSQRGFTLIELLAIVAVIGILTIIAIPNWEITRSRAYNANARHFGKQVAVTQGVYESQNNVFATNINQLLAIDRNLLDSPNITFIWVGVDTSGFTLNVKHLAGSQWYTYTD